MLSSFTIDSKEGYKIFSFFHEDNELIIISDENSNQINSIVLQNHIFSNHIWSGEFNGDHFHHIYSCIFNNANLVFCENYRDKNKFCGITEVQPCSIKLTTKLLTKYLQLLDYLNHLEKLKEFDSKSINLGHNFNPEDKLNFQMGVQSYDYRPIDDIVYSICRKNNLDYHPAFFPINLPLSFLKYYCSSEEVILDPFAGTGTTLIAAGMTGNPSLGIDLNFSNTSNYKLIYEKRVKFMLKNNKFNNYDPNNYLYLEGDSNLILKLIRDNSIDAVITSPPYGQILNYTNNNYSDHHKDISNLTFQNYFKIINEIFSILMMKLKTSGKLIINIPEYVRDRVNNDYIFLSNKFIELLNNLGFQFISKRIWDRSHIVKKRIKKPNNDNKIILSSYEVILHYEK